MRLARIAARQHAMITHGQLAAIGLGDSAIARRVASGRLEREYRGVFGVGGAVRTRESRWMAAVMASGPGAVLSYLTAALHWQIYESFATTIHVTTTTRSPRRLPGIRAHRSRRLDPADVTVRNGIPVTTVARTLVDLSDMLSHDRLLRAIREAEFRRLLDLNELDAAIRRAHGRRRLGILAEALARHRPGQIVRQELEHRFQELLHAAGVPAPQTNIMVRTNRRTYEVDCLWAEQGVAVELDGRAAHVRAAAFEEDRARDAALSAVGLRPLRFTWRRITQDASEVIAELRATLAQRSEPSCRT